MRHERGPGLDQGFMHRHRRSRTNGHRGPRGARTTHRSRTRYDSSLRNTLRGYRGLKCRHCRQTSCAILLGCRVTITGRGIGFDRCWGRGCQHSHPKLTFAATALFIDGSSDGRFLQAQRSRLTPRAPRRRQCMGRSSLREALRALQQQRAELWVSARVRVRVRVTLRVRARVRVRKRVKVGVSGDLPENVSDCDP